MTLRRGSIVDDVIDGHRVLIVQSDDALAAPISTVLVVPFTDAKKWGGPRRWVHECDSRRNPGLRKNSVAVVQWVEYVDKKTLSRKPVLGVLHPDDREQVEAKLRLIFDI